jgi:hypothetical protein
VQQDDVVDGSSTEMKGAGAKKSSKYDDDKGEQNVS